MKENGGATGALSVDRDLARVAAEVADIAFNPCQGQNLIQETDVVVCNSPASEVGVGEESESRQTVVDRDDDHFLALVDPVIEREICGVSIGIAPSVNVKQHGYWEPVIVSRVL